MAPKFKFAVLLICSLFSAITASAESTQQKFVVGLILPLSGELADYGEALRRGFELAEEELPELFRHIELRYQDSRYDQKVALNAFGKLEQEGDVDLYHVWGVSPNETILPIANERGRPVLAETTMRSAAVNRPFVINASRTGYNAAKLLVQAFVKYGWKHVGVVVTQIPYYTDIVDALKDIGSQNGIRIEVVGDVAPAEHDFRSLLVKSKGKDFDAFGSLLLFSQLLTFCEQANTLRFKKPMFGAHIHNSLDGMKRCLPLSEGAMFPGEMVDQGFRDRFVSKYQSDQRLDSAAHSYETAKIIAELYGNEMSHGYSAEEIVDRFKSVRRETSSVGRYEYTETPEAGKAIVFHEEILTYVDGQIVPFAK